MKKLLMVLFLPISLMGIGTQGMRHSLRAVSQLKTPAVQRNFGEVFAATQMLCICALGGSVGIGLAYLRDKAGITTRRKIEDETEELQRELVLKKIELLQQQQDVLAEQVQQALGQAEGAASDTRRALQVLHDSRIEKNEHNKNNWESR